jgi:hypothetical protein
LKYYSVIIINKTFELSVNSWFIRRARSRRKNIKIKFSMSFNKKNPLTRKKVSEIDEADKTSKFACLAVSK